MLEVVALFFLCKHVGQVAKQKGLSAFRWKLYTILGWFAAEITGLVIGVVLFGKENLIGLFLIAIMSAVGGYLVVKAQLDKHPDDITKDIDRLGEN